MAPEAPLTKDELVAKAKIAFKTNVANARIAATTPNSRDIDLSKLFPDWDKNTVIQNARRDNILGVVLKQTDREYWEIDFLFVNDRPAQLIKRFTRKDRCLTLYDGLGRFIQKGVYDSKSKTMQLFLTRSQLSSRARISADSTGGESTNRTVCVPTVIYRRKIAGNSNTDLNQSQNPEQNQNPNETWQNGECEGDGGESGETGGEQGGEGEQGGGEVYGEGGGYQVGQAPGEGGIEMGELYASSNESEVPVGQIYNGADVFYTGGNQGAGGTSGSSENNSGSSAKRADIKPELSENPCTAAIFKKLENLLPNGKGIDDFINNFAQGGNLSKFTLKVIIGDFVVPSGSIKGGETEPESWSDNNRNIVIKLNRSYINEATQLSIAQTILHESVHAYIFAYLKDCGKINFDTFKQDFPDVITGYFDDPTINSHSQFTRYIDNMANALANFDNHRLDPQYYKDLAWQGLEKISAYKDKSQEVKNRMQNVWSDEAFNNPTAQGQRCP